MIKLIKSLFHRRPVVVSTYRVKKTDLQKVREEKHRQLARELGREEWGAR